MNTIQILIADDDLEIAELIKIYLTNEGYQVLIAGNGREAMELIAKESVQLMILDVMMPEMNGLEVVRAVRAEYGIPILMLSAKAEDMDKIMGLTTGADDYMVKPFNALELIARVKSLLRRSIYLNPQLQTAQDQDKDIIQLHSLKISKKSHTVTVEDRGINLTSTEFDILYLLASHPGQVFSAEAIFEAVWKDKFLESNNTVMVHISKLRDKLESELGGVKLIQTVWGVGYKIDP
ncbi:MULTISPECIES: response regulator transcription factor [unclassified Paenibacillus]|uniref:response regulator transcription factor n=1 Tax=unclassified Paenibacillus TaxID=185978 RepID=UPI001051B6C2|nr:MULTISPECIES: response regulator transcription factor [unclassified Paenibacillus]NIK70472.1 DNA-binding response OmpR family regulator [Paenibacillus sp. BK720]TCM90969.1 DNA-binding response OmpR family regulator [Paenibacillus sp. BK033]